MKKYLFEQRIEEDYGLNGFAQAHLICQDGIGALSPGEPEPVEALQLVHVQRPACSRHKVRLLVVLYRWLEHQRK